MRDGQCPQLRHQGVGFWLRENKPSVASWPGSSFMGTSGENKTIFLITFF